MERLNWVSILITLIPTVGTVISTYMSLNAQILGIKEEIHLDASNFGHQVDLLKIQAAAHEKTLNEIESRMDGYEYWLKGEGAKKK